MIWQLCVALLLIWILVNRWRIRKLIKLSNQLKSDAPCWPIIGHAYKFYGDDEHHDFIFIADQMSTYQYFGREAIRKGGLASFWLGNLLITNVSDAADMEYILKNFLDKSHIMKFVRAVTGNGSAFAPVPIWRPRRKILLPTFNPKNLNQFVHIFAKQSSIMVEHLASKVGTGPFSIWHYLTTYSMDAVCAFFYPINCYRQDFHLSSSKRPIFLHKMSDEKPFFVTGRESALNADLKIQLNHNHPFLEAFEKGANIVAKRIISPWQHNDILFKLFPIYYKLDKMIKYGHSFIEEIIVAKRKEIKLKTKAEENDNNKENRTQRCKSFLELLIESSGGDNGYTNIELLEELQILIMAATDTSAVGAAFPTLMLSRHPDIQEKVYNELKEVFGDSKRPVTPEDLPRLKYLEVVIKESLRLYPPVPLILRKLDCDATLPSGIRFYKDCIMLTNIWAVHRNPKYWGPDAEQFIPERWLGETPLKHPAQYIPFSYGSRNCAGYQYAMFSLKTVLATMLRQYRVLPDIGPNTDGAFKPIRLKYDIMLKDVDNFMVRLERRL